MPPKVATRKGERGQGDGGTFEGHPKGVPRMRAPEGRTPHAGSGSVDTRVRDQRAAFTAAEADRLTPFARGCERTVDPVIPRADQRSQRAAALSSP